MAFKLEPIEIVAICLASLAVLLIIFYALYKLTKSCRTSSSASTTPIHESRDQYGYGGGNGYGYGYDHGVHDHNPYMNYPYSAGSSSKGMAAGRNTPTPIPITIQPSPSTGHTTLVTPSTASGGKNGNGHKLKKGGIGLIHSPWQSSNKDKDKEKVDMEEKSNDELVVVTYEDGLRKLGIQPIREIPQGAQGGGITQYRNVPPINTNVSFVNPNTNLYTSASSSTTTPSATATRPEMVERESSRRTYHSVAGRGHGAGRRGYTNTMGTMGSNLLPSYYIETNAGDD
ncbi:hypothetical protein I204_04980 [Kwoniella mangroviensis CBS 8886]|nr:hypothetical protein I204_04980 [Kwoniella mangroviensis CBS 8886]